MSSAVKRYVVFAYGNYYPAGGWSDHKGSFDTRTEARKCLIEHFNDGNDWGEVVDLVTGVVTDFNRIDNLKDQDDA